MTSMIDVVFLLLIFFMTTASFVKTERQLDTNIKNQDSASSSASDMEPAIVEIVRSGGQFAYRIGAREVRDAAQEAEEKVSKWTSDLGFRRDLYDAIEEYAAAYEQWLAFRKAESARGSWGNEKRRGAMADAIYRALIHEIAAVDELEEALLTQGVRVWPTRA